MHTQSSHFTSHTSIGNYLYHIEAGTVAFEVSDKARRRVKQIAVIGLNVALREQRRRKNKRSLLFCFL